jgi:arylsulfatase A-like enzyme
MGIERVSAVESHRSAGAALDWPLGLGLAVGWTDVALSLLERPHGLASFSSIFPPAIATAVFFSLAYVALWIAFGRPLSRRRRLSETPCRFALAAFLWLSFTLTALAGLSRTGSSPPEVLKAIFVLGLCGVLSVSSFAAADRVAHSPYARHAAAAARAVPFLLFEVVVFEWIEIYRAESLASPSAIAALAALLLAAPLTVLLLFRWERTPPPVPVISVFALFVAASPVLASAFSGEFGSRAESVNARERSPKQVILITADTLRADALSCYESDSGPTPAIDRLAADGIVFERPMASAPWTLASLASILTGVSPSVHAVSEPSSPLPEAIPTLAEVMNDAGYHTGAIVHNDLLHPRSNLSQGFDDYRFLTAPSYGGSFGAALLQRVIPGLYPRGLWPSTDDVTEAALDWLREHREIDFFLWLHYYAPHAPYAPPSRFLPGLSPPPGMSAEFHDQKNVMTGLRVLSRAERAWLETLYQAEVRHLDENVGRILDLLKELGFYDDALIVFTSDHGEEFWEHAAYGHGHSLFQEVLAVPLIVKLPQSEDRGRIAERVPTESITPAILDLCGIEYRPERFSSGSLAPFLRAEGERIQGRPIVSAAQVMFDRRESIVFDGFKYVRSTIGREEALFDLERDPEELSSVLSQSPEAAERARSLLEEHHLRSKELRATIGIGHEAEIEFDPETLRRLKELGYVP